MASLEDHVVALTVGAREALLTTAQISQTQPHFLEIIMETLHTTHRTTSTIIHTGVATHFGLLQAEDSTDS